MKYTKKYKKTKRRKYTRKQSGGFDIEQITSLITKESLENRLGLCTTYLNEGQYGTILKACFGNKIDCRPPCFSIKYVPPTAEGALAEIQTDILAHESHMMYLLTHSLKGDKELQHHIEQYIGSIVSQKTTPWLFTEYIAGLTLADPTNTIDTLNIVSLYFQTLLVLDFIGNLLPGFVHADLNTGNIFLVNRTIKHSTCVFEHVIYDDEGNAINIPYVFTDPYIIKLIDFGFSECNSYRWLEHPAHPSESIVGVWQLDAYMALRSFYDSGTESQKEILHTICNNFFGEFLANNLKSKNFDIYQNIHMLKNTELKSKLFEMLEEIRSS